MNKEELLKLEEHLEKTQVELPEFVRLEPMHWISQLYIARLLKKEGLLEETYSILRGIYEQNTFRYNKDIHGVYEDYIEEKVDFFRELAELSMVITEDAKKSIPYLDEAMIMLDGMESVYPYINPKEIIDLKEIYSAQIS